MEIRDPRSHVQRDVNVLVKELLRKIVLSLFQPGYNSPYTRDRHVPL